MTKQTEALDQEHIDAFIEEERQPSGEPQKKIGKVVLENTDLYNQAFSTDWSEWE